jgi:hypothetical protein
VTTTAVRPSARDVVRDAALIAMIGEASATMSAAWAVLIAARDGLLAVLQASTSRPTVSRRVVSPLLARELSLWNSAVAVFNRNALAAVDKWASVDLPIAYRDGAVQALRRAGEPTTLFSWTAVHQAALSAMTAAAHTALASRVLETVRRAQAFGRAVRTAATAAEGPDIAALLAAYPLAFVIYSNLSRYPVAAWLTSALTAQVATAANTGAAATSRDDLGVFLVEVVDGDECGWVSHDDPDLANGTVRTVDDAAQYPIAHPGCIREFVPYTADLTPGDLP